MKTDLTLEGMNLVLVLSPETGEERVLLTAFIRYPSNTCDVETTFHDEDQTLASLRFRVRDDDDDR